MSNGSVAPQLTILERQIDELRKARRRLLPNGSSEEYAASVGDEFRALSAAIEGLRDRIADERERLGIEAVPCAVRDERNKAERKLAGWLRSDTRHGGPSDPKGCFVYMLLGDDEDVPIYVGQSENIYGRLGDHLRNRDRKHLIKGIRTYRCKSKEHMDELEVALIRKFLPVLNVQHVGR